MEKVFFAGCRSYKPEDLIPGLEQVLAAFDFEDKSILVKPNWLSWKGDGDPASVHPHLVVETVKYLQRRGAKSIAVRETPGTQKPEDLAQRMGILEPLKQLGVEVSGFREWRVTGEMPDKSEFRRVEIADDFRHFDLALNLAKAKTHCMMTLTLAVKNLFGLIRGPERLAWHLAVGHNYPRFADLLLDLYLLVRPQINLVDGIVCMEGNGPGSGTPKPGNFLAAGTDALALDCALSDLVFHQDTPILEQARKRGLIPQYETAGEIPDAVNLELPPLEKAKSRLGAGIPVFLQKFLRRHLATRPRVNPQRCIGCGLCAKVCPPQTLKLKSKLPHFDYKTCIRCYCCQEHCPAGAITAARPLLLRIANRLENTMRKICAKISS